MFAIYIEVVIFSVTLAGCATWSKHGVKLQEGKPKLAILPVESTLKFKRLSDLQTVKENVPVPSNEQELISEEIRKVSESISSKIENGIWENDTFQIIPKEDVQRAIMEIVPGWPTTPINDKEMQEIGKSLDATVVLFVELGGYGKIKKKWLIFLIGSGVVEGIVQGVVASAVVDNTWVAIGVGAEEILQEFLTWGGGSYLFNKVFTPVIMDGRLLSVSDGKVIWKNTAFARLNRKALKQFPQEQRKKREIRLELTTDKAIEELIKDLNKTIIRNSK